MTYPRSWSRFHSGDQNGETKELIAEDIRERVRKRYPWATMETLERMSKADLSVLMHIIMDGDQPRAVAGHTDSAR
jgi:hypothetical protein